MVYYVLAVLVEYAIAFGLALLLNAQIRARKFFRVVFLMPLMLSPVAVSWMIGKSMLEYRFGPVPTLARQLGWDSPAFFTSPEIARLTIMVMDAWTFIPLMMVMLLAGLQALPKEVMEAAEVDGANAWQRFWKVVFPLMLPVSVTAIVIRIIFKLKLADIIINVTAGGPGGATDSVTSFIFREYRDRSNVGYGTLLAMVYLVLIIVFVTALAQPGQSLDATGHMKTTALPLKTRRRKPDRAARRPLRQPHSGLWRAHLLGVRLPLPDLLDRVDLVQDGAQRDAGCAWCRGSTFSRTGRAGARSGCRRTRSARPRPCATSF